MAFIFRNKAQQAFLCNKEFVAILLLNLFSNVLMTDKNLTYYISKFICDLTGESL